MEEITVTPVSNARQMKTFIDFPHELYSEDPNYVPEIYLAQRELHSRKNNPFFQHAEAQCFLAYRKKQVVGRVAAIHNRNYNDFHDVKVGFFGFFDVVNAVSVSNALLQTVEHWCKTRGLNSIIGPANYSLTTDTGGLLVDGFDKPPIVMMTYNKDYYQNCIEQYGFHKVMDLYAYMINTQAVTTKSVELYHQLEQRLSKDSITIRKLNLKKFKEESIKVKSVYQSAWEKNWGFNPPTDAEFAHLADGLRLVLDEDFAFIAEKDGNPIGFAISLPNINEVLIKQSRGRLFPLGYFRLLVKKKKTDIVRVVLLGVLPQYRKLGIEAIFFAKTIAAAKSRGIKGGEASWVLENNTMMVRALEKLNSEKYKTYRMYQYEIT